MADARTLLNLRRYIYKRPQDQTTAEVCAHIELVHARERLTASNWDSLLVPACTNPDAELVRWLVEHGARPDKQLKKLMTMTVGSREQRLPWIDRRIAVLGVLSPFCTAEDTHLSEALAAACGFGNTGPAAWLIEHGADIHFTSWNAFRHAKVDCLTNAEVYGARTGDLSLYRFLRPWYENGDAAGRLAPALLKSGQPHATPGLEARGSRSYFWEFRDARSPCGQGFLSRFRCRWSLVE